MGEKKKKQNLGIFDTPSHVGRSNTRDSGMAGIDSPSVNPEDTQETYREKWDKIGRRMNVEEANQNESGPNQEEKKSLLQRSRSSNFSPFVNVVDQVAGEPAPAMTYETPEEVSQSLSIYPKQATPEATEKWSNLLKATRDAVPTPNARLLDGVEGGISAADRAPPAPPTEPTEPTGASSKEEATQRVMYENNYGTGLGALKAMEDDKYELGSGSSLSEPARPIGPESGKYRRAARRLRRQGYGAAANQMAMDGERVRAGEPAIDTEELRAQRASMKMLVGRETQKQDQKMADLDERDAAFQKKKKEDEEEEAKKNENNRLASYAVNAAGIGNLV